MRLHRMVEEKASDSDCAPHEKLEETWMTATANGWSQVRSEARAAIDDVAKRLG